MWNDLWTKHQKTLVFAVGMICFLGAGLVVAGFPSPAKKQANQVNQVNQVNQTKTYAPKAEEKTVEPRLYMESEAAERTTALPKNEWVLYITGAVRRPGVYNLPAESRLLQLVEAAGGLNISADPVAVNLAAFLEDGLHVHVPEKGEEPPANRPYGGAMSYGGVTAGSSRSAVRGTSGLPTIDVNRASVDELTVLKGIGPALAGNVVEYRLKNGRFLEVDDLLHVKGIGRKKLEQFRDSVTVGP